MNKWVSLKDLGRRWEDIIKMDLQETGWNAGDLIDVMKDVGGRDFLTQLRSLRFEKKNAGNFFTISFWRKTLLFGISYWKFMVSLKTVVRF
jgi:hypothetical protein